MLAHYNREYRRRTHFKAAVHWTIGVRPVSLPLQLRTSGWYSLRRVGRDPLDVDHYFHQLRLYRQGDRA